MVSLGTGSDVSYVCPRKGTAGGRVWVCACPRVSRHPRVHGCPEKGITEDGVAWGSAYDPEGHCLDAGCHRACGSSGKGITGGRMSHVLQGGCLESQDPSIPLGLERCGTRHRRILPLPGQGSQGTGCPEVILHPRRVLPGSVTSGKQWHRCPWWFVLPVAAVALQP